MYRELALAGVLARYIECVWVLNPRPSENPASAMRILPDGAADIVIASGEGALAHGPATSFRSIPSGVAMVGFRLRTGAASTVLGVSLAELQPCPLSIRMLWGDHGSELDERLSAESRPAMRVALLHRMLMRRLADATAPDALVLATVERLRRAPGATVRELASDAGICERHLLRRFKTSVGMNIKMYARINRFQRLIDAVRVQQRFRDTASPHWASLAADGGYADQAHLIREVRAFSGVTPTCLLQNL